MAPHLHTKPAEQSKSQCDKGDAALPLACHAAAFSLSDRQPGASLPLPSLLQPAVPPAALLTAAVSLASKGNYSFVTHSM